MNKKRYVALYSPFKGPYIAPLEMKEPFLLRRRRKTHLLAGNIGTDPYIA